MKRKLLCLLLAGTALLCGCARGSVVHQEPDGAALWDCECWSKLQALTLFENVQDFIKIEPAKLLVQCPRIDSCSRRSSFGISCFIFSIAFSKLSMAAPLNHA